MTATKIRPVYQKSKFDSLGKVRLHHANTTCNSDRFKQPISYMRALSNIGGVYVVSAGHSERLQVEMLPAGERNEAAMIADIRNLEYDTEMYNEDCIKPSPYAFARVKELLTQSVKFMQSAFPLGTVYPDGNGALRVEWYSQNREVTLVIYSAVEGQHYIFHKEGRLYSGDYNVTPENLGCFLEWLNNNERPAN